MYFQTTYRATLNRPAASILASSRADGQLRSTGLSKAVSFGLGIDLSVILLQERDLTSVNLPQLAAMTGP